MGTSREIELEGWNKELSEKIKRLEDSLKQLHKEFTEQAIKIDEKNATISALRRSLEYIQYMINPMGNTENDPIYNVIVNALKKYS